MAKQIETAIVCTTIFEPAWLAGYLENLRAHGRDQDTAMIIIIDRKTPPTVAEAAAKARAQGYDVRLPSLDEQVEYLARLGAPADWVPWNTDNRRNIGFLMALESGAQRLISIDDDNYCLPGDDFVGSHAVVGQPAGAVPLARGATWFNICGMLGMDTKATVHARGFPYAARRGEHAKLTPASKVPAAEKKRRVAINAGLWLSDPDVDAATRLTMRPDAQKVAVPAALMGPEVWTPINTQNTGLIREAVFAYYYVRMGFPLQGLRIDRFGDILSGYFVQKVAKHLGDGIRLGAPVAEHRRSPHNLFKDLYFELAGMVIVEEMLPWLIELKLEGSDYASSYASLADAIAASAPNYKGFIWDEGGREFLVDTSRCMHTWLDLVRRFK